MSACELEPQTTSLENKLECLDIESPDIECIEDAPVVQPEGKPPINRSSLSREFTSRNSNQSELDNRLTPNISGDLEIQPSKLPPIGASPYKRPITTTIAFAQQKSNPPEQQPINPDVEPLNSCLPQLESFDTMKKEVYRGPTDESNWVIPGHLMIGAYPGDISDKTTYRNLGGIMRLGIGTFVCLQQEYDPSPYVTEAMWRGGLKLRPYYRDVQKIFKEGSLWNHPNCIKPPYIDFIHFPIVDLTASASDSQLLNLCKMLCERLDKGEKLYIHCWGGHGRSGSVGSIVIGLLYNLKPSEAMDRIQYTHDLRNCSLGVPSPQTTEQRLQVARVLLSPSAQNYMKERQNRIAAAKRIPPEPCTSTIMRNNNNNIIFQHSKPPLTARPSTVSNSYRYRTPRNVNLSIQTNNNNSNSPTSNTTTTTISNSNNNNSNTAQTAVRNHPFIYTPSGVPSPTNNNNNNNNNNNTPINKFIPSPPSSTKRSRTTPRYHMYGNANSSGNGSGRSINTNAMINGGVKPAPPSSTPNRSHYYNFHHIPGRKQSTGNGSNSNGNGGLTVNGSGNGFTPRKPLVSSSSPQNKSKENEIQNAVLA